MTRTRIRNELYKRPYLGTYYQRKLASTSWEVQIPSYGYLEAPNKWNRIETTCDELHEGPPYLTGGPFDNFKASDPGLSNIAAPNVYTAYYPIGSASPTHLCTYVGGFQGAIRPTYSLDLIKDYRSELWSTAGVGDSSSYGATAWKKFKPNKPVLNLGQDAFELRQIPKMMQQTAKTYYKLWQEYCNNYLPAKRLKKNDWRELGGTWLNTQFGWAPFYKSVIGLYNYQAKATKRYEWLRRNNGNWVRRHGHVDVIASSSVLSQTNNSQFYANPFPGGNTLISYGSSRQRTTQYIDLYKKVSFEAKMRYYIPDFKDVSYTEWSQDYVSRLGLTPSPSLLYELTPWSWLFDWFSNLGDVLDNLSTASEQVVAKYAYVMAHTTRTLRVETLLPFAGRDLTWTWRYPMERKQRVEATPFGFNLSWPDFSGYQLSILSALGLSRMP